MRRESASNQKWAAWLGGAALGAMGMYFSDPDRGRRRRALVQDKDAWRNYENFPYFMSHVLEVRDLGEQRSHWVVQGPMGSRVEWNAGLTECIRPSVLAWKTDPGAVVEHAGLVHFEPTENGTIAIVRLSYNPPAGALGHSVAVLLGSDPKRELDDDLMRMKSFIETGIVPHDAAKPIAAPSRGLP